MSQSLIGTAVGNYRIVDVLGEGGMGTVYRAIHPELDRTVAIKVLAHALSGSDDIVRRFRVEARAVNKIKHPNVVDVQDFGMLPDGRPYYVMEHLSGESLGGYLTRVGPLAARDVLVIMLPTTEALEAAHNAGVVHRDLKPDNIFLLARPNAAPIPKLLDFGIAKVLSETIAGTDQNRTRAGSVMGTPIYMSPEQAAGRVDELGTASDVYSLGVIIYEMLCGKPPFESPAFGELLMMHMQSPPPPLSSRVVGVPAALETLVMRMLAKSPAERPRDAAAVRQQLITIKEQLALSESGPLERTPFHPTIVAPQGSQPGMPSGVAGEVSKQRTMISGKRPLIAALAAVTVAVATIAIVIVVRSGDKPAAVVPMQDAPAAVAPPVDAFVQQAVPIDAAPPIPVDAPVAKVTAPIDAPYSELELRLGLLKELYDAGKIDQQDYDTRRKRILEEWMPK